MYLCRRRVGAPKRNWQIRVLRVLIAEDEAPGSRLASSVWIRLSSSKTTGSQLISVAKRIVVCTASRSLPE
ncbi:hypothetical protein PsorP6_004501 [Peronosclerospora sorghi]|uniref:Uncharacterized protein n=1 Tax=Peronosclerospora sorghi TaxID=230839 RepID=A0ACC0VMB4_9STRA|nr:hypothetical protein PsorP6_004501 [Peronosclerospora sorghi]